MKIIKCREYAEVVTYHRTFDYEGEYNSGFRFECDKHGALSPLTEAAKHAYEACVTGIVNGYKMVDRGIVKHERTVISPAVGKCDDCGQEVTLDGFTNTCQCGADYNMSGQRLASREQWGEETGEDYRDVLAVDNNV